MERKDAVWHPEVIPDAGREALGELHRQSVLERFYLAGGTGLALRLGHRQSVDFDFFCGEKFDEDVLLEKVQHASGFALLAQDTQTLHVQIRRTKVSFLGYPYRLLFPLEAYLGVKVADPRDIACMKISAIAGRGASHARPSSTPGSSTTAL
ncbi:MAG: nucleotidyl transferase AbiEii/AbiGii toxin family protein [Acidobacteria bacterium]|nr:nucleotidyl transferase AbiEii/AbiGii toxin family protein [Acidobacteriota bacterium]